MELLTRAELLTATETAAHAVAELVRESDLDLPVPSCPGWTAYELVGHLGGVHRWATAALSLAPDDRPPAEATPPRGMDNAGLAQWFAEGAATLLTELRVRDPDQPCWTFADPTTVAFWVRRQAHETSIHRWDLERAVGEPPRIDQRLAYDGVDEVLGTMLPRQIRLGRTPPIEGWVSLGPGLALGEPVGEPVATVTGTPHDLLLTLWRRPASVRVEGDRAAYERIMSGALTP